MNADGSINITSVDIFDMQNEFCPGRAEDIQRATEYVKARSDYKFNRSVSICMRFVLALTGVMLFVGFWFEIFQT